MVPVHRMTQFLTAWGLVASACSFKAFLIFFPLLCGMEDHIYGLVMVKCIGGKSGQGHYILPSPLLYSSGQDHSSIGKSLFGHSGFSLGSVYWPLLCLWTEDDPMSTFLVHPLWNWIPLSVFCHSCSVILVVLWKGCPWVSDQGDGQQAEEQEENEFHDY